MKKRFIIESNGIWDTYKNPNKKMSWKDLCNVLNELNSLANEIDEYEYIIKLETENQKLKLKIVGLCGLLYKIHGYVEDMKTILKE